MPAESEIQTPPITTTDAADVTKTPPPTEPEMNPLKADINKLIEKARKDEKDKQYGTVEKLRGELEAARSVISEKDSVIKNLSVKPEDKKPEDKKVEGGLTEDKLQIVLAAALKRMEDEVFSPQLAKIQAENDTLKRDLATKDLNEYRTRLLSENDGQIIPELVAGTTREELDTTLIQAKQIFARTAEALTKRAKGVADSATQKLPSLPPANGNGTATPGGAETSTRNMSLTEWSKNRVEMLKAASAAAREQLSTLS